ncbi:MAG: dTMP kinase [Chloroflexi bacterium]|nr:dTMP kinase [Chloroflexota bacterium]
MGGLVALEGPDGSGKSTQLCLLREVLEGRQLDVVWTREPGGTVIGEQIRTVLHDLANDAMLPITEALLYSAARAQHVAEVIRPALARGALVITDRYAASTLAYQGYGHGLDIDMLRQITVLVTGGVIPDLTIYLDLPAERGLERKLVDRSAGQGEWNRMDQQALVFHRAVRAGYLEMAQAETERWLVLDADDTMQAIHQQIMARIEPLLT